MDSGSTSDTTVSIGVPCGAYYRWHVRATDGVGNTGDWSSDGYFYVDIYPPVP